VTPSLSGGGSRSTQREPPTMDKQLDNFITGGWESGAPFFVIYILRRLANVSPFFLFPSVIGYE
jgi:hypothetical protein